LARVLFALDLGSASAATEAAEAVYVSQSAGDVLAGFEIGNGPDLFAKNGLRAATYSAADFLSERGTYAGALKSAVAGAVLTGPADSGNVTGWTALAHRPATPALLIWVRLPRWGANASNAATIPNLLGAGPHNGAQSLSQQLQTMAQAVKVPWRMAESNSCYNGGQTGVSDVFASALWGVDYLFTLASGSAAGVNFHGGGNGTYTPIAGIDTTIAARPLYYAMLFLHAAARGRLAPLDLNAGGINFRAHAALDSDGTLLVAAINLDSTHDARSRSAPAPPTRAHWRWR
jgi:hypothetical protein